MTVSSLSDDLLDQLRTAMAVELSTLPPYLYAWWTIRSRKDGGSAAAAQASRLVLSVVYEEMLHMGLVSNVLAALGGRPAITDPRYLPTYPGALLDHSKLINPFTVSLDRLRAQSIQTFLDIELPSDQAPPTPSPDTWSTIGEFYATLKAGLPTEAAAYGHGRQLPARDNPGAGVLFAVDSRAGAGRAIDEIMHQGEGLSSERVLDGDHELAHYFKFRSVQSLVESGQLDLDADVWPVVTDPNTNRDRYTDAQRAADRRFSLTWSALLDSLQVALCSSRPTIYGPPTQFMNALGQRAAALRAPGEVPGTGELAGPTFTYLAPAERGT